ncbi:MAG: hypothetical protein ACM3UZ_02440 [Acidobacteriota bacterium]
MKTLITSFLGITLIIMVTGCGQAVNKTEVKPTFGQVSEKMTSEKKETKSIPVAEASIEDDNPIEEAFAHDFDIAYTTGEMNGAADAYADAWKQEMTNAAKLIRANYKYKEDSQIIDRFVYATFDMAEKNRDLERLNWTDNNEPPNDRWYGTGSTSADIMARAEIYKRSALTLIYHYEYLTGDNYTFNYHGKGAEIEKWRRQIKQN